jgi:hypothetical protein
MNTATERTLTEIRIESASAERDCVDLWHKTKHLLDLVNSGDVPHRGTYVIREPLLDASQKISEAMNAISAVKDLLEMIVPDPALAQVDGDADGVD